MEISIIKIGNSKGFRLSKDIISRYKIKDKVEVIFEKGYIILKPIEQPRKGWEAAFKEMNQNNDDQLLMEDVWPEEDFEQWS